MPIWEVETIAREVLDEGLLAARAIVAEDGKSYVVHLRAVGERNLQQRTARFPFASDPDFVRSLVRAACARLARDLSASD